MNLTTKISHILESDKVDKTNFVKTLLNNPSIYLVGKNNETINFSKLYNVIGIIDDTCQDKNWRQFSIFNSKNIDIESLIVNCSTSILPNLVNKNLRKLGFRNILHYSEVMNFNSNLQKPLFQLNTIDDYEKNSDKWNALYELLSDDESKKTLERILLFRLTCNPKYTDQFSVCLDKQYMETFMNFHEEIMIDVGGFDGETTDIFCTKFPDYKKIFVFEPSDKNFQRMKERLVKYKNIHCEKIGLSNKCGTLYFDDILESASKVSICGSVKINVETLDNYIKDNITFIKLDIEGWELNALIGSTNHIKSNHPKIAVAVYHNSEDFWKIPEFVLNVRDDYDVYLRHYTEGWSETIMYFNPR